MSQPVATQQRWHELVNLIAERLPPGNAKLLLTRFRVYDNIPRKKKQFLNFLRSSFHLNDNNIAESVWDSLQKELDVLKSEGVSIPADLFAKPQKKTYFGCHQQFPTPAPAPIPLCEVPSLPHVLPNRPAHATTKGPRSTRQPKAKRWEEIEDKMKEKGYISQR
ncbi:unnamed protein product [Bursaphelenchus okinawaensis]|uniref:Uncharacterized protein n=1 Tax=Bursaphelenchus okinawaensis TaxID=465554 RepID=A0A811LM02_9BILA|nr:unnamed protein product [Bursaphelenchus okinawaensis]CAG9123880.1 unnamed protein product [Bursaphelenchus okinawaensis]